MMPLSELQALRAGSRLGEAHDEPIFLVTNFLSASKACEYYSMRFTIETSFRDHKSRAFNIARSHLSSSKRLTRLMYASCLAYLWIIFLVSWHWIPVCTYKYTELIDTI